MFFQVEGGKSRQPVRIPDAARAVGVEAQPPPDGRVFRAAGAVKGGVLPHGLQKNSLGLGEGVGIAVPEQPAAAVRFACLPRSGKKYDRGGAPVAQAFPRLSPKPF